MAATNKNYKLPYTLFSSRKHPRIIDLFRLRNIENDLNDFIKFQEAEHARFKQYADDMIFREMYVPFTAVYNNSTGVTIAPGATTKVPVECTIQLTDNFNPDFYDACWLQSFSCNVGGVARITLNDYTHNEQNHTLYISGGCFVFNPKTENIKVTYAEVGGVLGKNLQKAWRTFNFNNYTEKNP